ncbi:hypothetical protein [Mesorhizobium sp. M0478]|uniref:hypothetical protein n=1 Tax=Mesorhizobium sp. M0478 TaxID=2956947 RepID=UPI00333A2C0F
MVLRVHHVDSGAAAAPEFGELLQRGGPVLAEDREGVEKRLKDHFDRLDQRLRKVAGKFQTVRALEAFGTNTLALDSRPIWRRCGKPEAEY